MNYYLINNRVMKGKTMPIITNPNNDSLVYGDTYIRRWHFSLQPCEISESELEKIKAYHQMLLLRNDPIDITDIGEELGSVLGYYLVFKHPKQQDETNEAVEFAIFINENYQTMLNNTYYHNNWDGDLDNLKIISIYQLYETFKNRKL